MEVPRTHCKDGASQERVLGQKPGFGNEPWEGVGAERPFFIQARWAPGPATAMLLGVSGCVWWGWRTHFQIYICAPLQHQSDLTCQPNTPLLTCQHGAADFAAQPWAPAPPHWALSNPRLFVPVVYVWKARSTLVPFRFLFGGHLLQEAASLQPARAACPLARGSLWLQEPRCSISLPGGPLWESRNCVLFEAESPGSNTAQAPSRCWEGISARNGSECPSRKRVGCTEER